MYASDRIDHFERVNAVRFCSLTRDVPVLCVDHVFSVLSDILDDDVEELIA